MDYRSSRSATLSIATATIMCLATVSTPMMRASKSLAIALAITMCLFALATVISVFSRDPKVAQSSLGTKHRTLSLSLAGIGSGLILITGFVLAGTTFYPSPAGHLAVVTLQTLIMPLGAAIAFAGGLSLLAPPLAIPVGVSIMSWIGLMWSVLAEYPLFTSPTLVKILAILVIGGTGWLTWRCLTAKNLPSLRLIIAAVNILIAGLSTYLAFFSGSSPNPYALPIAWLSLSCTVATTLVVLIIISKLKTAHPFLNNPY